MPTRPRGPGSTGSRGGGRPAGTVAAAQQSTHQVAQQGRGGSGANVPAGHDTSPARAGEDPAVADAMRTYEQLGADPPKFDIRANDAANPRAHTLDRHGHDIPLVRDPGQKTVEGRIYGDAGWSGQENQSFKWDSPTVMTREINDYVQRNWDEIRSDLAVDGVHEARFNAGHRVGEGFMNGGMYGFGPRQAEYMPASLIKMRIRLVEGADPAQPYIVSAFPAGH